MSILKQGQKFIKPDILVFDCGDTLLELNPAKEIIFQQILSSEGMTIELDYIKNAYKIAGTFLKQRSSIEKTPEAKKRFFDNFNYTLCEILGIRSHADKLNIKLQKAFKEKAKWCCANDTISFLNHIYSNYECYVLANWSINLSSDLDRLNLLPYFTGIYSSEEIGFEKPDHRIFDTFIQITNSEKKRKMYIGNEYIADIVGSRESGFTPLLFDKTHNYPNETDCYIIRSWNELLQNLMGK